VSGICETGGDGTDEIGDLRHCYRRKRRLRIPRELLSPPLLRESELGV